LDTGKKNYSTGQKNYSTWHLICRRKIVANYLAILSFLRQIYLIAKNQNRPKFVDGQQYCDSGGNSQTFLGKFL
jgi:hypothetical protein